MNKNVDFIDYTLIVLGTSISIPNLQELLGVILLVIQIIWLLIKLIVKITTTIKNKGNLNDLDDDVSELTNTIGNVITKINNKDSKGDKENER